MSKPVKEGPRQTGFRGDTPANDQVSYKGPAAVAPFPNQSKIPGFVTPGTPNRANQVDPNLPQSGSKAALAGLPPSGIAAVGSAGPSTVTYAQAHVLVRKAATQPTRK